MSDRYIVTTVAEARGKRASGWTDEATARDLAALMNDVVMDDWFADDWWSIGPYDTCAIVDTAHAAPARVPCEGWRKVGARSWRLVLNEYAEIEVWQPGERWTWELRLGSPMSKSLAEYAREPFDAPEAAMLAAEDAAEHGLLRAGLRAMGRE